MTEIVLNLDPLRDSIYENLRSGVCEVSFNKKDGSFRKMIASLHPSKLPTPTNPPTKVREEATRATEQDQIRVFDLHVNAWRSFVLGNFIGIRVVENLEY